MIATSAAISLCRKRNYISIATIIRMLKYLAEAEIKN